MKILHKLFGLGNQELLRNGKSAGRIKKTLLFYWEVERILFLIAFSFFLLPSLPKISTLRQSLALAVFQLVAIVPPHPPGKG
jgi:hypothetical protein